MTPDSSFEREESPRGEGANTTPSSGSSGGATDIFQTLASPADSGSLEARGKDAAEPVKVGPLPSPPPPAISQPVARQAAPAASSAGFTQLLRALSPDMGYQATQSSAKTKAPAAVPPSAPVVSTADATISAVAGSSGPGSVTQMLRLLEGADAGASSVATEPRPLAPRLENISVAPAASSTPSAEAAEGQGAPAVAQPPGSFTQLFSAIPDLKTAPVERPAAPAPGVVVGGAFAQNSLASPTSPKVELEPAIAAPPPTSGSFTQMFQALGSSPEEARTPEVAVSTTPASPSVSPVQAAPPPQAAPAEQAPGSFTAMLDSSALAGLRGLQPQALDTERLPPEPQRVAEAGSVTQTFGAWAKPEPEAAVAVFPKAEPAQASAPSGSFTQLFRALDSPEPPAQHPQAASASVTPSAPVREEAKPLAQPAQAPAQGGSFTQLFKALDMPAPTANPQEAPEQGFAAPHAEKSSAPAATPFSSPPPAPSSSTPGTFTQLFKTLDSPPPARSSGAPAGDAFGMPAPKPPASPPSGSSSGTFTQLFRTLDAAPAASGASSQTQYAVSDPAGDPFGSRDPFAAPVGSQPFAPAAPSPSSSPSSFTQLFSSPEASQGMASGQRAAAGSSSFPGSFGSPAAEASPFAPAASRSDPLAAAGAGSSAADLGASQMFGTYTPPAAPKPAGAGAGPVTSFDLGNRGPVAPPQPAPSVAPSQGGAGLTQLLQTLGSPTPSVPAAVAPSFPTQPASQPGAFTATYGALSQEAPSAPVQGGGQPFALPGVPSQSFSVPSAPAAGPSEFTRILNASSLREAGLRGGGVPGGPAVPSAPAASAGGGAPAMPSWAAPAMPKPPTMPSAPPIPQIKLPEVKVPEAKAPEAGAPQTKLQQYYPLLLVMIIFLLVAILIAVIFLIKH